MAGILCPPFFLPWIQTHGFLEWSCSSHPVTTKEKPTQFWWVKDNSHLSSDPYYTKKKKIISLVKPLLSGLTYFGTEHFPRWYRYQAQNYMFQILKASPWKQTTERQREFHLFYIWVVQGLAQLIFLMLLLSRLQRDWIEFYKHWFRLDCMFPSNKERESFPLFPEQSALNFLEWFFTFQIMTVLFT